VVTVHFHFRRLSLPFEAKAAVQFPASLSANVFRGALGTRLPRHLFAPVQGEGGPSGLADPPRPFVIRARQLDARSFQAGDRFTLELHLFAPVAAEIAQAFSEAEPFHGAVRLTGEPQEEEVQVALEPEEECDQAKILFLTPTELKHEDALAMTPEFPILFARAAARLRTLAQLYGDPLTLDFDRLATAAGQVRMTDCQLVHEFAERRSTRTGQRHPLGGFTGTAYYEGVSHLGGLGALLPILRAAQFTGVGRQTVWGKGEIQVRL
jgi:hypothetical protein